MKVTVQKYVSGTFVETYEQTFEVPDNVADPMDYLQSEGLLDDADWGDHIKFDDNIQDEEYELTDWDGPAEEYPLDEEE